MPCSTHSQLQRLYLLPCHHVRAALTGQQDAPPGGAPDLTGTGFRLLAQLQPLPFRSWRTASLLTGDCARGTSRLRWGEDSAGHHTESTEPLDPHRLHSPHLPSSSRAALAGCLEGGHPGTSGRFFQGPGGCHPLQDEHRAVTPSYNCWEPSANSPHAHVFIL